MKGKAIALLSGGLDSTLAILIILKQDIDVTAITFLTHFGCSIEDHSSCSKNPFPVAEKFGFKVKLYHLSEKFVEIVKNPKFGRGKNMNPCIDCRILMLKEAKELMDLTSADFVITGEVLGQRPMSQKKEILQLISRQSRLDGRVLRPLSARLLPPTIPEVNGIVDRERLYGISGRSRKQQIVIAKEFGLVEYPNPAGGCLLTDPIFSKRLRDLLRHNPEPDFNDLNLLKVGRHFRVSDRCKVIVGRNKQENQMIVDLKAKDDCLLEVKGIGSPLVLVRGTDASEFIELSASICARYSDSKDSPTVSVDIHLAPMGSPTCQSGKERNFVPAGSAPEAAGVNSWCGVKKVTVEPAKDEILEKYRI